MKTRHRPVMLRETLTALDPRPGQIIVDGTVGAAGHSQKILQKVRPGGRLIGLDRDPEMLARAARQLAGEVPESQRILRLLDDATLVHASYAELGEVLEELEIPAVDAILVDLGLSSDQLESRERGFGFKTSGKLDMRFDPTQGIPVSDWLRTASVEDLTTVLRDWGEEPFAREIAAEIVNRPGNSPVETADELAELVESVYQQRGKRPGNSHPATRTFQALRIQANAELEHLQRLLSTVAPATLKPGGKLAVISFHSLEDRMAKQAFQNRDLWSSASRKPIVASPLECKMNPRSRSAKLRIAIRAE